MQRAPTHQLIHLMPPASSSDCLLSSGWLEGLKGPLITSPRVYRSHPQSKTDMCNGFPGNKKPLYFLCKQRHFSIITLRWEPGPSHLMQSFYPSKGQHGPAYGRCFEDSGSICPCADILIINLWNYSRERGKVIVRFVNTMILSH